MTKPSPRYTLALDMGNATGWALAADNCIVGSGVMDFRFNPNNERPGHRLIKFHNFLQEFAGVHEILYESVIGGTQFGNDVKMFLKLLGVLEMFCAGANIQSHGIHPSTLKKRFTGNGHAEKEEMCAVAHSLGWTGGEVGTKRDNDECDAIAIIFCILKERGYDVYFKTPEAEGAAD